jgi:excisionase family DNA binding protein
MPVLSNHVLRPIALSDADQEQARLLAHILSNSDESFPAGAQIPLSRELRDALSRFLLAFQPDQSVIVLPAGEELTPSQAAELLGVSRPLIMRAIHAGEIPHRLEGSHHRLLLVDLLAYKNERERRARALRELTEQAQELDMGY